MFMCVFEGKIPWESPDALWLTQTILNIMGAYSVQFKTFEMLHQGKCV